MVEGGEGGLRLPGPRLVVFNLIYSRHNYINKGIVGKALNMRFKPCFPLIRRHPASSILWQRVASGGVPNKSKRVVCGTEKSRQARNKEQEG